MSAYLTFAVATMEISKQGCQVRNSLTARDFEVSQESPFLPRNVFRAAFLLFYLRTVGFTGDKIINKK